MNLADLRDACRTEADDIVQPYLWTDDQWNAFLNDAEREACIRARLIRESESDVAELSLSPDQTHYRLSPLIIDVLKLVDADGREITGWDLTEAELILSRAPSVSIDAVMTIERLPRNDMTADGDTPEIGQMHHDRLIDWALHRAYLKKDAETYDPSRAQQYAAAFEASFGARRSASVLRKHKRKSPRVVRAIAF